ncbi:M28 family peptidase [Sphaerochaeta sp. PS]|uniref:M28 family peptidase n=1 Tax=Sphaerochaeta sp. PS TaxID=3076336 RepID=UPI0028A4FEDC|nr:M28 family peptidase [Sphaerochaeta sp. PS]MDT4762427.1 M28 family peptidase [Sphaerochaeta sp. PS]
MRIPKFFQRKKNPPPLVIEESGQKKQKLDTLKAGKLASLALELTSSLINEFGPRVAGTKASRESASKLEGHLKNYCDSTAYQEFSMHDRAYTLWIQLMVGVYPAILLLLWFGLPLLGTLSYLLFCLYVGREYLLFKPIGEKHTPSTTGANVHGCIEPEKEVLHTVIFSGHHDSARLYRYNKLDRNTYLKKVFLPFLLFFLLGFSSILQLTTEVLSLRLFVVNMPPLPNLILNALLTLCIPLLFPLRNFVLEEGSPGAGDNLISSAMCVELARFFDWKRKCGSPLQHTRLVFCSFDGEEVGLRGSRVWFDQNLVLLEDPIQLNFDSPYYEDELTFLERDVNGLQSLSSPLARRCVNIAKSMGYRASSTSIPLFAGGTDAASGARCGVEATTLTAVAWDDRTRPAVYHTSDDVVSAIETKAVEHAISIAIRLVELVDSDQLYEESETILKESKRDDGDGPDLQFSKFSIR